MGRRRKQPAADRFFVQAVLCNWRAWLPGLALVALVAVVYWPAFKGGWVLDDEAYVTANPHLRTVGGLGQIWLHPLARTSLPDRYDLVYTLFWVEYHLWGAAPLGFHAVNIALHAACVLLLWRLLMGLKLPGAWLAAALFAVHPVCVESVAWVTEGKNTLSLLLALAAMLSYLRFEPAEGNLDARKFENAAQKRDAFGGAVHQNGRYYVLSLALFAAALLSKTQVVALPGVLLIVYWWKRGRVDWRLVKPLLPFAALAVAFGGLTIFVETQFNGASGADYSLPWVARILVAAQAVWFYLGKLLWPFGLSFIYPRWAIETAAWGPYVLLFAAVQTGMVLWLARGKIGRGPLTAALIFGGLLLPVLGFFNVCFFRFSFVADHFQYHAATAMLALFAAALSTIGKKFQALWVRTAYSGLASAVLAALVVLSFQQSKLFESPATLYADTLAKNPACWLAHNNLANALQEQGEMPAAIDHYRAALQLKPDYAEAHVDLGVVLAATDRLDEAIEEFKAALQLRPNFAQAYNSLGAALAKQNKTDAASENYERAIQLNPDLAEAHFNQGALLLAAGKTPAAIDQLRAAIQSKPDYAEAHGNLGAALATCGKLEAAISHDRRALELKPDYPEAQYNLGIALLQAGQTLQAIPAFRAALRLNPNDVQCALDLSDACAQVHQMGEALWAAETAGKLAQSSGQTAMAQKIQAWIASLQGSATMQR